MLRCPVAIPSLQLESSNTESSIPSSLPSSRHSSPHESSPMDITHFYSNGRDEPFPLTIPHLWLCEGTLLYLLDPSLEDNMPAFQHQWRKGLVREGGVCVCVCVCVHARVRACVRACVCGGRGRLLVIVCVHSLPAVQPVLVAGVDKRLTPELWTPQSFGRDFGEPQNSTAFLPCSQTTFDSMLSGDTHHC